MTLPKLTKPASIGIILGSGLIAWTIANIGLDYDRMELGALLPLFVPPIITAGAFILFLVLDWAFPKIRFLLVLILVIIILWNSIQIRMESICC